MTQRKGSFAIAFGSGFAVLTIEIAGARLIAPVFGLSVVPWTAVIGVILAALAVGSHLGGRMA
ncbi:MAG: fused MFS/spermidine synthase, partial [Longimicrobiales bacterium]